MSSPDARRTLEAVTQGLLKGLMTAGLSEDATLLCSHCGDPYTHFKDVRIYRRSEDKDEGLRLNVDMEGGPVVISTAMGSGNPSSRRSGVVLTVWCENCDAVTAVSFAQHKGETFVTQTATARWP